MSTFIYLANGKFLNIESFTTAKDLYTDCKFWATIGECTKFPSSMIKSCPQSCSELLRVSDKKGSDCYFWAIKGDCTKNQSYMIENCQHSCTRINNIMTYQSDVCNIWRNANICTENPSFMLDNCPESCSQQNTIITPTIITPTTNNNELEDDIGDDNIC
jgi:hypothetical protein